MIIGYARVSTTEQNLGLQHDDLKPAFDASVDVTDVREATVRRFGRSDRRCPPERHRSPAAAAGETLNSRKTVMPPRSGATAGSPTFLHVVEETIPPSGLGADRLAQAFSFPSYWSLSASTGINWKPCFSRSSASRATGYLPRSDAAKFVWIVAIFPKVEKRMAILNTIIVTPFGPTAPSSNTNSSAKNDAS